MVVHKKELNLKQTIKDCVAKDIRAEKLLYTSYYGYVSGVAFRYLREPESTKELVNDAFIKIFKKIDSFHFVGEQAEYNKVFKGWIGKITANLAIDKIRSAKQLIYLEEEPEENKLEMIVEPIDCFTYQDMMALLAKLPAIQQLIFNLYAIEGFSHEEIAVELNILPNTSRVYLKRARQKLIFWYQKQEHEQRSARNIF